MQPRNNLNVYKGPDSVKDYFNPDRAPLLPLVELPNSLNPYRQDGVRIYAKMMTMHPANNVKSMPGNHVEKTFLPKTKSEVLICDSTKLSISWSMELRPIRPRR